MIELLEAPMVRFPRTRLLIAISLLLTVSAPPPLFALKEEYERNGEAYMLIGEGTFRGVYNVNNHNNKGLQKLYDPKDAYGLSVDKDRNLYTFASVDDSGFKDVTGNLERMVKRPGGYPGAPGPVDTVCFTANHCADTQNVGDLYEVFHK